MTSDGGAPNLRFIVDALEGESGRNPKVQPTRLRLTGDSSGKVTMRRRSKRTIAPLHQNSRARMLTETEVQAIKPLRYSRKFSDGRGLYLLVTPKGGRRWRFAYRFAQKHGRGIP